jgi:hypothetical protein
MGERMKLANMSATILPFCVLLMSVSPSKADDLRDARRAVSALLKKNGGGLVAQSNLCPTLNNDEWEYVETSQVVPINESSNAILIDSRWCNGGRITACRNERGNRRYELYRSN